LERVLLDFGHNSPTRSGMALGADRSNVIAMEID
jgi:hypothetical protein